MVRCFSHITTFLKLDLIFFLRLPVPRPGQVLGLVGTNGIGKSTALKILAGKVKPNLGKFTDPPNWDEIMRNFRGSELQKYFTRLLEDKMKVHYRIYQKISPTDVKLQCSVFWCIYGYYLFPHLTYRLSIIYI
jgi:translation initiation factor RLI1